MANEVVIVNQALARLGAARIMSLDDTDSESARQAKLHYVPTVKAVLRSHRWNCCTTRTTLARLADAPAFGWSYAYQLPNDFLRAIQINQYSDEEIPAEYWRLERDKILTNEETVRLIYVYYEEDAEKYDDLLVEALVVKLAAKLAGPITGDPNAAQSFLAEYKNITSPLATRTDAVEDRSNENHPLMEHLRRSPMRQQRSISNLG